MNLDENQILKILNDEDYISKVDLLYAEKFCSKNKIPVITYLIQKNLITNSLVGQAIAESFNVPYADLEIKIISATEVLEIPEEIAKKYHVIVYDENNEEVVIATDNIDKKDEILKELKSIFSKKKISLSFTFYDEIIKALLIMKNH